MCTGERILGSVERIILLGNLWCDRAVVVAQLVERLLPILEVRGSNPAIGQIYVENLFTINFIEKTKINEKEAGNGPF